METNFTTIEQAQRSVIEARVDEMPIEVVRQVLWHFGEVVLGEEPGGFFSALLVAMGRADAENFLKLSLVFEHYTNGFSAVARTDFGLELLRDRAKAVLA